MQNSKHQFKLHQKLYQFIFGLIPVAALGVIGLLAYHFVGLRYDELISKQALATDQLIISNTSKDDPATSLTIYRTDDIADSTISANRTQTAYREYKVNVKSNFAETFSLGISKETDLIHQSTGDGDIAYTMESSASTNGSTMPESKWGYTWSEDLDADSKALTYKAVTSIVDNFVESQTIDQDYQNNGKLDKDYKLAFAAKFSADQPEGSYSAKVNVSLTVTPRAFLTFTLNYDCNGGDDSTCPSAYTTTSQHDSVQVYAQKPTTTPTRTGYTFIGWGDKNDTAERYTPTSNPITINRTSPSATVYAVWKLDRLYMQDMTFDQCTTEGVEVYDKRNENVPYIVKLIQPNGLSSFCWMTSNLKLEPGTPLTVTNSNVKNNNFSVPANTNDPSSWSNDYCKAYMAISNGEYYYNWAAATARTTSSNSSSCSSDTTDTGDICPKGWRLPVYNGEISSSDWRSALQSNGGLLTSGFFYSGKQSDVGSIGYWWSSTRASNQNSYYLNKHSNGLVSNSNHNKYRGHSVRCLRTS